MLSNYILRQIFVTQFTNYGEMWRNVEKCGEMWRNVEKYAVFCCHCDWNVSKINYTL